MKKIILFTLFAALTAQPFFAQVTKKVVLEHFTNSLCSACASRNPGLYNNINNQTNVIHLAIHPSAPYSGCLINQHNTPENNGRTNYYGIFGSTPRIVINGVVISSSTNYSSNSIFNNYVNQTSPASIKISQTKYGNDSIRSTITIKTEAQHALGNLKLFVALVEDTLFYSSPNGEDEHYDVFRKSLTGTSGTTIILPSTVGDSIVFSASSLVNTAWDFARIYTLAVLQEDVNKSVVQAEAVSASSNNVVASLNNYIEAFDINVFPNPANEQIHVKLNNSLKSSVRLYDLNGKLFFTGSFQNQIDINLLDLSTGQYLLVIENDLGKVNRTINKQ